MSDEFSKTAPQILAGLAKDIYQDVAHPPLKTIGEALDGIFKAISHYPRYWGMISEISLESKRARFRDILKAKVEKISDDKRVLPKPNILGPSLQALEYGVFEDHLSDMFASLLASSMNSDVSNIVHPAFAEIIKQLTSDEAKLLKMIGFKQGEIPLVALYRKIYDDPETGGDFEIAIRRYSLLSEEAECENPQNIEEMLDNLERLKLIDVQLSILSESPSQGRIYNELQLMLENALNMSVKTAEDEISVGDYTLQKGFFMLTSFGKSFVRVCLG